MRAFVEDLVAGTTGGCVGIVVGQPLDTVKVLQQTHGERYKSAFDCFVKVLRYGGIPALFAGMSSPLVGNAPLNAILFASYGTSLRYLQSVSPRRTAGGQHPLSHVFLAGCWGGALQCFVVTPVDLVKCRLQVWKSEHHSRMTPYSCLRDAIKVRGMSGMFQGWWPTFWRDVPSFGGYFLVYEYVKRLFYPNGDATMPVMLLAGGFAGIAGWGSTYPFDVIKSNIQTMPSSSTKRELRMVNVAKKIWKLHGIRGFTRGLAPTLVRSVPVNAVTFLVYEIALDLFRGE